MKRSRTLADGTEPPFISARTVADAVMSEVEAKSGILLYAAVYCDIADGKDKNRKTLAARAGLRKFLPIPPNSCLTSMIANSEPITGTQRGAATGRFMPRRIPVTAAEPSVTVIGLFKINSKRNSKPIQATMLISKCASARRPKT